MFAVDQDDDIFDFQPIFLKQFRRFEDVAAPCNQVVDDEDCFAACKAPFDSTLARALRSD